MGTAAVTIDSGDSEITVSVDGLSGEAYYLVWRTGISDWSALSESLKVIGSGDITLTGLTNGVQYEAMVVAYDGSDYGFPSQALFATPSDGSQLPAPLRTSLRQTCVYWPPAAEKWDDFGQPVVSPPSERICRWEHVNTEIITSTGTRIVSTALVYLELDVEEGGVLMLGTLSDVISETDPKANPGAWEILKFDKLPTIRATKMLRRAYL